MIVTGEVFSIERTRCSLHEEKETEYVYEKRGNLTGSETSGKGKSEKSDCGLAGCRDFSLLSCLSSLWAVFQNEDVFDVPFSFENPVHGSQTIEDIVGLFTKSNTTNNTQDEQSELRSSQRSYSCTHVTDLQREQKEPGTQRTDKENWDPNAGILFSTDVKKIASQRESEISKQSSDEDNGTENTRKSASPG
ncbi:hypothetical protein OS493_006812 [Desmophyllum pertusum]|uniref:Uncharacterized protein n=1 Tax=Desmophyllum pertusum TaxID=174260 RepID=A0A9W9ZSQ1_9CNID|nr:hypothetical protein OS493_006812 [Desmophyllum pertusum]